MVRGGVTLTERRQDQTALPLPGARAGPGEGTRGAVVSRCRNLFGKPWSVYGHLLVFGLALIIPMAVLSAALLRNYVATERQKLEQRVGRLALEISRDYEREITSIMTTLDVMAKSPVLIGGDAEAFRSFALSAAQTKRISIVLRDRTGRKVFSTMHPEHQGSIPFSGMSEVDRRIIAEGAQHVTDVHLGALRKQRIFVISVPITAGPFSGYALNGIVEPADLATRINLGDLPAGWIATIHDRSGNFVAHSSGTGSHHERSHLEVLRTQLTGNDGIIRSRTATGDETVLGYQRSQLSGWLITVSLPLAATEALAIGAYYKLALFALGLVFGSIGLAAWFGRAIAHPVSLLAERANNLEQRWSRPLGEVRVKEVGEVMRRLDEAAERLAAGTQELRLSESRYRRLATSTPAGLFRTDAAGTHTFINERWCAITGIEPEQALTSTWLDVILADDRPHVTAAWREAMAKNGRLQVECRVADSRGRVSWVLCEANAETSEDGSRVGTVGSLTDLTERKAAEQIRREGEDRLRLALELGHMGTFTWTMAADRIELDPIAAAIFGWSGERAAFSYGALRAAAHDDDAERIVDFRAALQATTEPCGMSCRIRRKTDGALRYVGVRAVRQAGLETEGAGTVRVIGVLFDVTEQALAERSLEEINSALERRVLERTGELAATNERLKDEMRQREAAQAALTQAQKLEALGQLTSSVAHDFNNQLMAVLGGLELIEKGVKEPRLLRHAQNARTAARRASQLTDQLLSFSRKGALAPGRVDIVASLAELDEVLRYAVGNKVSRRIDIAPDVEPVWADPDQLHATLLNIAINARDAMAKGGELKIAAHNVLVDAEQFTPGLAPGRYVAISLTDSGIGMTEDVLQRATEPFFTTKPRGQGTGLGLAMAARFAEQSRGRLQIASRPGQGTRVEVVLPVAELEPAEAITGADSASRAFIGRGRVLCVDDDRSSAEVTADLLRGLGYDITLALDPVTAVAEAHSMSSLDLLVTDIDMPEMDGFAVADAIRQKFPDLYVLYVTGHLEHVEQARERSADLAGAGVMRKPFSSADLKVRLSSMRYNSTIGAYRKQDLVI